MILKPYVPGLRRTGDGVDHRERTEGLTGRRQDFPETLIGARYGRLS
ncbi:MAG TPA: hypothetical protein VLA09_00540 [Longimicrobiales bacterium]|nr:hypothetical protein [Longimicrobiales bacterium]